MKAFTVAEIRRLLNGVLEQGPDDLEVRDTVYYFEQLKKENTLFFLRSKQEIDWSKFQRYTPCAIITDEYCRRFKDLEGCAVITVKDIETAYWSFINYYRNLFDIPVVAVTGTSGKTTTKDMIKHILRRNRNVIGTVRSANAGTLHLSYLMDFDDKTEVAVLETAVLRPGDIKESFRYFKPMIGIITNIGTDHLDKCKTQEGYIRAKEEMVTQLDGNGILIINADDENSRKLRLEKCRGRIVYFGIKSPADFRAYDVQYGDNGMEFVLKYHKMDYPVFVPGYGEHQVYNALAAIAAVHELGVGIKEAADRLYRFEKLPGHLELGRGIRGSEILDDTWNINITSLKSALEVLNSLAKGRKKVAVIGSMDDLGDFHAEIHRDAGDLIMDQGGLDALVTIGWKAEEIARRLEKRGFKGKLRSFRNTDGAYDYIEKLLDENTILLAKCSMYHTSFKNLINRLKEPQR